MTRQNSSPVMPQSDHRKMRDALIPQLTLVFLISTVIMALFHDVRIPLDGSSYALSVQQLANGDLEDAFRWSHVFHVPVLFLGYKLVSIFAEVSVLSYYQILDILLGSGGLSLLYLLVFRVTHSRNGSISACWLVLFSWVYWIESVTADEKILGFFFVLVYLNMLEHFLGSKSKDDANPNGWQAVVLATTLSFSILLHASAVLVIPLSVFLVIRKRAFRFGIVTTLVSAGLILVTYALILNSLGISGRDETTAFFSSGVSSYSVASTGISGLNWIRSVAQGTTKLTWAVFSEDGLKSGLFFAGLNGLLLAGILLLMWQHRRRQQLHGFIVLFFTALVFGVTYAPDSPDSYFMMLIPIGVFFALAWEANRFRYLAMGMLVILTINNGTHYLGYSAFRDPGSDRSYQEVIRKNLAPGDGLVILDAKMGVDVGIQTITPLHRYFNQDLKHIPSSEFFSAPGAEYYMSLARQGRLYIEGLCFEVFSNRLGSEVQESGLYLELSDVFNLEPVIHFSEYSSLLHRSYKSVFRLLPKTNPQDNVQ